MWVRRARRRGRWSPSIQRTGPQGERGPQGLRTVPRDPPGPRRCSATASSWTDFGMGDRAGRCGARGPDSRAFSASMCLRESMSEKETKSSGVPLTAAMLLVLLRQSMTLSGRKAFVRESSFLVYKPQNLRVTQQDVSSCVRVTSEEKFDCVGIGWRRGVTSSYLLFKGVGHFKTLGF